MAEPTDTVLALTAQIVSAHVAKNPVETDRLPELIREVYRTLAGVVEEPAETARPKPAVPATKSVFADYIVCLEDGKKMKMLKRHLMTDHKLTPEQYRARWGLPSTYPMVAANYAKTRSALAKKIGLGQKRSVPRKMGRKRTAKA
ncbi:MAG TPA: MucR family transcriptional regulator [Acetobacteraceae bacterium]|jgi:predicted transcriptional regulator|nr:MucR family transcriptional regulator [Acetobacteraceae bacterium]